VTPRALTLALKDLAAAQLVERRVTPDYPPATVYRLRRRARPLARILSTI
jgi:DNA-binding HxlR family transcriptional regulator